MEQNREILTISLISTPRLSLTHLFLKMAFLRRHHRPTILSCYFLAARRSMDDPSGHSRRLVESIQKSQST